MAVYEEFAISEFSRDVIVICLLKISFRKM